MKTEEDKDNIILLLEARILELESTIGELKRQSRLDDERFNIMTGRYYALQDLTKSFYEIKQRFSNT